jgi:hypothetical protein
MKYRPLRRRKALLSSRISVRAQLPWPLRVLLAALLLGAAAAVAVWAYDAGRRLTGTHAGDLKAENQVLREKLAEATQARDQLSGTANTVEAQLQMERTAQQRLAEQVKALEADNSQLKEDLAFFESLLPAPNNASGIQIRGFRVSADDKDPRRVTYHVLLMQGGGKAFAPLPEFRGGLQLVVSLVQAGKPATITLPDAQRAAEAAVPSDLRFTHYQRIEGVFTIPTDAVVKSVLVRVVQNGQIRASQSAVL